MLLSALPERFHPAVQRCLDQMDSVMSLPMVLLHRDIGSSNVLVSEDTCHLTGVIDWAEAEVCPFGQNLHSLEAFTGAVHLRNGWRKYADYKDLQTVFWATFTAEIGSELSLQSRNAVETSRVMGLLLDWGFTKRLGNMEPPRPICCDEESGRYSMLYLDGHLISPATQFIEV